ncbi:MAG: DNA mismatch repair endonuclease MutL [bacterium]
MIKILSEETINKIAAGEVVERPVSIVKELVENSIDSGAKNISVEISGGGHNLIQVADDGCGMSYDDVVVAFERHATSKISSFNDVVHLKTLGFRGEALASIAAVSEVKLFTRTKGSLSGVYLLIENGKIIEKKDAGTKEGTRIEITKLFWDLPARRKFLKSQSTEMYHISRLLTGFALAYPDIYFSLNNQNKENFTWPKQETLKDRIYQIFGKEVFDQILPIKFSNESTNISGFISHPLTNYSNRNQQFFLVNGRIIKNRVLDHAIQSAYKTLMPESRYPFLVISIQINGELVDVNVHPTKREVRFLKENNVHDILENIIKDALFADKDKTVGAFTGENSGRHSRESGNPDILQTIIDSRLCGNDAADKHEDNIAEPLSAFRNNTTESLFQIEEEKQISLKIKGQIKNTYMLLENKEGLLIVDQHALEERILYEKIKEDLLKKSLEKQSLLFPLTLEISPQEVSRLEKVIPEFTKIGFDIEFISKTGLVVREVPALSKRLNINSFVHDVLTELPFDDGAGEKKEELFDDLIKMLACRSAVKAGDFLEMEEMKKLIYELAKNDFLTCPHGRPIFIKMTAAELEKKFKRK